jgi:NAD(P)-dependent dehydrogenase (short-subunit alcohol dehydrogenase family)
MPLAENPVWFITGCSTGFGRHLAEQVLARGWRAVVTARDADAVSDLVQGFQDRALALALDVTDTAAIKAAVAAAESAFGAVDVLVNNAGYGYLAAIEEGEDAPVRKMFETNVFGLVEMTKAVLPGMRRRRSGTIVNLSSIGGLVSFGATGYYHATKYAVEGLSESLAVEIEPLGLHVVVVEPGPFRTDFAGRSIGQSATEIADYAATAGERRKQTFARSGKQVGDPVRAAKAMIEAVAAAKPPRHLLLGRPALDLARQKLAALKADFDAWEAVTVGADYPEGEGGQSAPFR